jgi:hypothetical protein
MEGVRAGRVAIADARVVVPAIAAPHDDVSPDVGEQGRARLREIVASLPTSREKAARAAEVRSKHEREATLAAKLRAQKLVDEFNAPR